MASIINALSSVTGGIVTSGDASGILQLQTANTAAVTVTSSQFVGIGTTNPIGRLTVSNGGAEGLEINPSGGTVGLTAYNRSGAAYAQLNLTGTAGIGVSLGPSHITTNSPLSVTNVVAVGGATPASTGSGITFPATQSASSNANTLDDYQEGSYTGTLTGCTTSPTTTVYYTKIGNVVHLNNLAAGITGTSNASTLRITGMPALIRPANTTKAAVQGGISGSVSQTIWVQVLSNGDLYCEQGGNAWPTSGVKGFDSGFGITYSTY
jgi:hypothetical protein